MGAWYGRIFRITRINEMRGALTLPPPNRCLSQALIIPQKNASRETTGPDIDNLWDSTYSFSYAQLWCLKRMPVGIFWSSSLSTAVCRKAATALSFRSSPSVPCASCFSVLAFPTAFRAPRLQQLFLPTLLFTIRYVRRPALGLTGASVVAASCSSLPHGVGK
jgi:hypothetical protein